MTEVETFEEEGRPNGDIGPLTITISLKQEIDPEGRCKFGKLAGNSDGTRDSGLHEDKRNKDEAYKGEVPDSDSEVVTSDEPELWIS